MKIIRLLLLITTSLLFLPSCSPKAELKLPNTKGLPDTTNFYAELDIKAAQANLNQDPKLIEVYTNLLNKILHFAKEKDGDFSQKYGKISARMKDAGMGDFSLESIQSLANGKSNIDSIVFGMTLPESPIGLIQFTPAKADIILILHGTFLPERTLTFCKMENISESSIEGHTAWNLNMLTSKIIEFPLPETDKEDKTIWFTFADKRTLLISTKKSLQKSLRVLKGEHPSLKHVPIEAARIFNNWTMYATFNNPKLIRSAMSLKGADKPADRMMINMFEVIPMDQIVLITGQRNDCTGGGFILNNTLTKENVLYFAESSLSLNHKIFKVYDEFFVDLIKAK